MGAGADRVDGDARAPDVAGAEATGEALEGATVDFATGAAVDLDGVSRAEAESAATNSITANVIPRGERQLPPRQGVFMGLKWDATAGGSFHRESS